MPVEAETETKALPFPQTHRRKMGFWARATLPTHLINTLDRYNLDVRTNDTGGTYHLFSKNPNHHPRNILPNQIAPLGETDTGYIVDMQDLERALEFMHQPVRCATPSFLGHNDHFHEMFNQYSKGLNSTQNIQKELRQAQQESRNPANREIGQSIFRFLTTASVSIPTAGIEDEDTDHASQEKAMHDKDAWILNNEAGHAHHREPFDPANPPEDKVKTIPGFYFDPDRKGYVLQIHPALLNETAQQGTQQKALRDRLFKHLSIQTSKSPQGTTEITLSPNQLADFGINIHTDNDIRGMISAVKKDERAQKSNRNITETAESLKNDAAFQNIRENTKKSNTDNHESLQHLLSATTALIPVIGGTHMHKIWNDYFPSRRDKNPFDDIITDYLDMKSKIENLLNQNLISHEELQAFALEYHQLLAFTDKTAKSLGQATSDQNTKSLASRILGISASAAATGLAYLFTDTGGDTNLLNVVAYGLMTRSGFTTADRITGAIAPHRKDKDHDIRTQIHSKMNDIGHVIQNLSIGGIQTTEENLPEEYQETLSVMRKALDQDGSFLSQTLKAGKQSAGEFIDDIFVSLKTSRVTQATTAALATYLIWSSYQGDSSAADLSSEENTTASTEQIKTGHAELDALLEMNASAAADIPPPPEPESDYSCHTDFKFTPDGLFEEYKHCIFGPLVEDQASNIVSGTEFVTQQKIMPHLDNITQKVFNIPIHANEESIFFESARDTIKPTADVLLVLNWLQNITHAFLGTYAAKKGWNVGFEGYNETFSFMNPLYDITHRTVHAPFRVASSVLSSFGINAPFLPEPSIPVHEHLYRLVEPGKESLHHIKPFRTKDLDDSPGIAANGAQVAIKLGGFKQQFNLTDHRLATTKTALNALDIKLKHMDEKIGVETPWQRAMMSFHLKGVQNAINDFEQTRDPITLKQNLKPHLGMLSGFELRQTGRAQIFNALTGQQMDVRTEKVLTREANIAYGKEKRFAGRMRSTAHLVGQDDKQATLGSLTWANISLAANHIADKTIGTLRNIQRGSNYIGNRPVLNYGLKISTAALIGADIVGVLPENEVAEYLTATLGGATGIAATSGSFVIFNSGEDIILIHTAMMATLISGGAVSALAIKNGIAPATAASAENIREKWNKLDMIKASQAAKECMRSTSGRIDENIRNASSKTASTMQRPANAFIHVPKSRYHQPENELTI